MTLGHHNALRTQSCRRRTHGLTVRPRPADSRSLLRIPWRAVRSSVRGMIWDVSGIRQLELLWGFPLQDGLCALDAVGELSMVLKSAPKTKPSCASARNDCGGLHVFRNIFSSRNSSPPKINILSSFTHPHVAPELYFLSSAKGRMVIAFFPHTIKACEYMWPVDFRRQKAT